MTKVSENDYIGAAITFLEKMIAKYSTQSYSTVSGSFICWGSGKNEWLLYRPCTCNSANLDRLAPRSFIILTKNNVRMAAPTILGKIYHSHNLESG